MADDSLSINNLDLSVRTYYCLHRAGLFTVGQIARKSTDDLLALPSFGHRALGELRSRLVERGFPDPWPEILAMTRSVIAVDSLDIWPRTQRSLVDHGIRTLVQLMRTPGDDLLDFLDWQELEVIRKELIAIGCGEPGNIDRDWGAGGPR